MTELSYKSEIYRKIFHICLLILPISYFFLTRVQILNILVPITIPIVAADYFRHYLPKLNTLFCRIFGKIMRVSEKKGALSGISNTFISAVIVIGLFEKTIAINAFIILVLSVMVAEFVGKKIKSKEFFDKSVSGSIAFCVSAFSVVVMCGIIFNENYYYYLFGLIAVAATTIVEARPSLFGTDDNLSIPLTFAITMFLFSFIWSYN